MVTSEGRLIVTLSEVHAVCLLSDRGQHKGENVDLFVWNYFDNWTFSCLLSAFFLVALSIPLLLFVWPFEESFPLTFCYRECWQGQPVPTLTFTMLNGSFHSQSENTQTGRQEGGTRLLHCGYCMCVYVWPLWEARCYKEEEGWLQVDILILPWGEF